MLDVVDKAIDIFEDVMGEFCQLFVCLFVCLHGQFIVSVTVKKCMHVGSKSRPDVCIDNVTVWPYCHARL